MKRMQAHLAAALAWMFLGAIVTPAFAQQEGGDVFRRKQQAQELTKNALFVETFEVKQLFDGSRWFKSTHEKYSNQDVTISEVKIETAHLAADHGLVLDKPARHYGLAVELNESLQLDGSDSKKEMVVQYEVKLQKQVSSLPSLLPLPLLSRQPHNSKSPSPRSET